MDPEDLAATVAAGVTDRDVIVWPPYRDLEKPAGYQLRLKFVAKKAEGVSALVIEWPDGDERGAQQVREMAVIALSRNGCKPHRPATFAEAESLVEQLFGAGVDRPLPITPYS